MRVPFLLVLAASLVVVVALLVAHASSRGSDGEGDLVGGPAHCKVHRRGCWQQPSTTTVPPTTVPSRPQSRVSRSAGDRHAFDPAHAEAGPTALATWYSVASSSSHTASGETLDDGALTFAHRSMAFGTLVRFCRATRCVVARCNDRGPFVRRLTFDLSRATFEALAPVGTGVISVAWERV